jgi:hypothetical protein
MAATNRSIAAKNGSMAATNRSIAATSRSMVAVSRSPAPSHLDPSGRRSRTTAAKRRARGAVLVGATVRIVGVRTPGRRCPPAWGWQASRQRRDVRRAP